MNFQFAKINFLKQHSLQHIFSVTKHNTKREVVEKQVMKLQRFNNMNVKQQHTW